MKDEIFGWPRELAQQVMWNAGHTIFPERAMHPNAKMSGGDKATCNVSAYLQSISGTLKDCVTYKSSNGQPKAFISGEINKI